MVEDNGVLLLQSSEAFMPERSSWTESREDPINLINKERIYTTAVSLCCSEVGKIVSC